MIHYKLYLEVNIKVERIRFSFFCQVKTLMYTPFIVYIMVFRVYFPIIQF